MTRLKRSWQILFAFLLGMVVAELSSDPTDYIFFGKALEAGFTTSEAVAYWYLLTAAFYAGIFLFAYFCAKLRILEPYHIVYIMMILVLYGFLKSSSILKKDLYALAITLSATCLSLGILWGMKRRVD